MRTLLNINDDTPQGSQAITEIQPSSLTDLIHANSAMRLMASDSHPELPLITFAKQKRNLDLWYSSLNKYNLTSDEITLLEKYLLLSYGLCIDQETIMKISMDKNISGFNVMQANKLRKAIAKKKIEILEEVKFVFYSQGEGRASKQLLDYVWNEAFMLSAGYGFSVIHSTLYSYIAIQQAYMNVKYPSIYWNTARLLVESKSIQFLEDQLEFTPDDTDSSDDEQAATKKTINYFKMASAIGKIRRFGVDIEKPNINKSLFTFRADAENNKIWFGLRGIARIGQELIESIIANRPYSSIEDLLEKVKLNKLQLIMLIKAGALDDFGDRKKLLSTYCRQTSKPKSNLNLQNVAGLLKYDLFPESLKEHTDFYKIYQHCKKHFKFGDIIVPDNNMWQYLQNYSLPCEQSEEGDTFIQFAKFKKAYDSHMAHLRNYIKANHDEMLAQYNEHLYDDEIEKYANNFDIPAWEMEALSMYYGSHELDHPDYRHWLRKMGVVDFESVPEEPIIEWQNDSGAKMFKLYKIAGTCVGRDKSKYTVGLLTTDGFVEVKVHRERFLKYDRQIKEDGVTEPSWWSKGQKVFLTGYRNGENKFMVKTYKRTSSPAVAKILKPGSMTTRRLGEEN